MTTAYDEFIEFIAAGTTPESVVAFRPSEAAQARVSELLQRQKETALSPDDSAELAQYLQLEHVMRMARARARQRLAL